MTTFFAALGVALVVLTAYAVWEERAHARHGNAPAQRAPTRESAWTDAIELGVAVLIAMRDRDDATIVERLRALGVEPWLAERLVTWLPDAFARPLLPSVTFLDRYTDPIAEHRFEDDPIWRASRARADHASHEELLVVAARSAVMNAVSNAGHALSEVRGEAATALVHALPTIQRGDGGVPEPRAPFARFVEAHGLVLARGPGTEARGGELAIDAFVLRLSTEGAPLAQVDFHAKHPRLEGGALVESFAAHGDTYRAAIGEAIDKFQRGSLHVILAALVDESKCRDQVSWEGWLHPCGDFRACFGAQLLLSGAPPAPLEALIGALRDSLRGVPLSRTVHTLRIFCARERESCLTAEVLLDGAPWAAGEALCRDAAWPVHETPWATRLFLMLVPTSE